MVQVAPPVRDACPSWRNIRIPFKALDLSMQPQETCRMAALTGYFDDSGDDGFFSIGGYVAEAPTWDRFGSSWQATLSRFNVRYLHMKELNQGWGEYSSWKKDDPLVKDRIVEFFISLTSVIRAAR